MKNKIKESILDIENWTKNQSLMRSFYLFYPEYTFELMESLLNKDDLNVLKLKLDIKQEFNFKNIEGLEFLYKDIICNINSGYFDYYDYESISSSSKLKNVIKMSSIINYKNTEVYLLIDSNDVRKILKTLSSEEKLDILNKIKSNDTVLFFLLNFLSNDLKENTLTEAEILSILKESIKDNDNFDFAMHHYNNILKENFSKINSKEIENLFSKILFVKEKRDRFLNIVFKLGTKELKSKILNLCLKNINNILKDSVEHINNENEDPSYYYAHFAENHILIIFNILIYLSEDEFKFIIENSSSEINEFSNLILKELNIRQYCITNNSKISINKKNVESLKYKLKYFYDIGFLYLFNNYLSIILLADNGKELLLKEVEYNPESIKSLIFENQLQEDYMPMDFHLTLMNLFPQYLNINAKSSNQKFGTSLWGRNSSDLIVKAILLSEKDFSFSKDALELLKLEFSI